MPLLTKSKFSAVILSLIAVLTFSIMGVFLNLLASMLILNRANPAVHPSWQTLSLENIFIPTGIIVVLLIILTVIGAIWIYKYFGERYYGKRGALHWSFFGFILAVLVKLPTWILADRLWLLKYTWLAVSPFVAFFLARRITRI